MRYSKEGKKHTPKQGGLRDGIRPLHDVDEMVLRPGQEGARSRQVQRAQQRPTPDAGTAPGAIHDDVHLDHVEDAKRHDEAGDECPVALLRTDVPVAAADIGDVGHGGPDRGRGRARGERIGTIIGDHGFGRRLPSRPPSIVLPSRVVGMIRHGLLTKDVAATVFSCACAVVWVFFGGVLFMMCVWYGAHFTDSEFLEVFGHSR